MYIKPHVFRQHLGGKQLKICKILQFFTWHSLFVCVEIKNFMYFCTRKQIVKHRSSSRLKGCRQNR